MTGITQGPFPAHAGRLLLGIGCLAIGLLMLGLLRHRLIVDCDQVRCVVEDRGLGRGGIWRFSRGELKGARVDQEFIYHEGNRKTEQGRPVLLLAGSELRLMQVSPREASLAAERVRAFVAGSEPALHLELRTSPDLMLFPLGFLAAGLALLGSGLRGVGRVRLFVDLARQGIAVKRSCLGVPLGGGSFSCRQVSDVMVERQAPRNPLRSRGTPAEYGARLVLLHEDGARTPLTARFFRGDRLHREAAEALRVALGLTRARCRRKPCRPGAPCGLRSVANSASSGSCKSGSAAARWRGSPWSAAWAWPSAC